MWKNFVEPDATDECMAHAHCMLDTYGYKHTLTVRNTYCSFHYNSGCLNAPQCYVNSGGEGIDFERAMSVLISSTFVSETFLFLRKTEQHMVQHVYRSSYKVPIFLLGFNYT